MYVTLSRLVMLLKDNMQLSLKIKQIIHLSSYCEGNKWATICSRLPTSIEQIQIEIRHPSCVGHDNVNNYALLAA